MILGLIKKILIILTLFSLGLVLMYWKDLKPQKIKEVYVFFNSDINKSIRAIWEANNHLFPKDFEPRLTRVDRKQLLKLNEAQRRAFDSISNWYYSGPRKFISLSERPREYGISMNYNEAVFFEVQEAKELDVSVLSGINFVSIDSVLSLVLPSRAYMAEANKVRYDFYLVEVNTAKDKIAVKRSSASHALIH